MQSAAKPDNELDRLQALFDYHVLDSDPEEVFDELTELASSLCKTPIALVSLIDETRQWFKSHHGLGATETPREYAFCAHAILQDDIFEIEDSREDKRFFDNPLVTGYPEVIFYAGAPLIGQEGYKLGTLCVIDNKPNSLSPDKKRQLRIIANQVMAQLELRKSNYQKTQLFDDLMGVSQQLNQKNEDLYHFSSRVAHDIGGILGQIKGFSQLSVMDLEKGEVEDALNKHQFIGDACNRLQSLMKDIFDLSKADLTHDTIEEVDLPDLLMQVIIDVNTALEGHEVDIQYGFDLDKLFFSEVIRIRQVLYNLISNAVKYANPKRDQSFVHISFQENESGILMTIKDNGLGIPEKYHDKFFNSFERFHPSAAQGSGLGSSIIQKHIKALKGSIDFDSSEEGTEFRVSIPNQKKA